MVRLPRPKISTVAKATVGATAIGVGAAALAGALPGTEGVPGGLGNTISGFTDGIGSVFNGATSGLAGLLNMSPLLVIGGGALALLVLLK